MLALVLTAIALLAILAVAVFAVRQRGAAEAHLAAKLEAFAGSMREEGRRNREEMRGALDAALQPFARSLGDFAKAQHDQLTAMRSEALESRNVLEASQKRQLDSFSESQSRKLGETNLAMKEGLEAIAAKIKELTESNEKKQDAIREALTTNLKDLREENGKKLEEMRRTVDEKLHETLEKRLGESFKLVSERLEQVHTGLGEMKTLANGVGDLKRVLTNVKSRGSWGEVQLGMLLDDLLTPEQFARNVRIRPESGEVVEFAVRLPGASDGVPLWLPIDCKFPQEDYERLVAAHDSGVAEEVERHASALERAVRTQAKTICEKYVHPPHSTDFAIMYLPTEGLYAEVARRPGLTADMQKTHRVITTGPTTLSAILTSLQMGFRTLAIEKRSSDVWRVLGEAKSEFRKYGEVWDKLGKQLDGARKIVDDAGVRTRAVERKLRDVEILEVGGAAPLLLQADADEREEAA